MTEFEIGRVYNRREEIHGVHGGQRQGGISTPTSSPDVFIFTGDAGLRHGYGDCMQPDGVFWYYGEGQQGDMELVRGNLAVANHAEAGKHLHLFEYVEKGRVRYVGPCQCLDYHRQQAPDRDGNLRQAIVFELEIITAGTRESQIDAIEEIRPPRFWSMSEEDLLASATQTPRSDSSTVIRRKSVYQRSEAVRVFALRRADGKCEGCGSKAPFVDRKNRPFLEVHHLYRRADGGPDHPNNVVAICPNCHRRVHHGKDGDLFNEALVEVHAAPSQ